MNRVEIRGGLTREPVFKYVGQNDTPLLEFTVAVNGTKYDHTARSQVVVTTYVACQVWGLQADEIMQRYALDKGDEVHVVGELAQVEVPKSGGGTEKKTRVLGFVVTVLRARHAGEMPPPVAPPPFV